MATEQSPLLRDIRNDDFIEPQDMRDGRFGKIPLGLIAILILIIGFVLFVVFVPHNTPHPIEPWPTDLTPNIFSHLKALNEIAKHSNKNSRSITNGYNASAEYIISTLINKTNCDVKLQYFKVPIWEKEKEAELSVSFGNPDEIVAFQGGIDFWSMRDGGQAASLVSQEVVKIQNPLDNKTEWNVQGKVALIQFGNFSVWDAAYKAEQNKASAVIFYNSPGQTKLSRVRVRIAEWKEGDPLMNIPVLAASNSLGRILKISSSINITTYTKVFVTETFNVICHLNDHGHKKNTIVLGAHLDSVSAGPGMVDNASGAATLLEILLTLEKQLFEPKNRLVFAWWGAEEIGLGGSRHFVRELLKSKEKENIAMYLNFDMLGSPNYIPFILQGSDAPPDARDGSIRIQHMLEKVFDKLREPYDISDMLGGSDFLPFIQNSIPSGGIYTGSSEIKSRKSQQKFGGIANAPLDPCYHQACDILDNVSEDAIELTSKAALEVIINFGSMKDLRDYLESRDI
ncbi:8157_t:CDS:2 [Dentiscutata erythropus]|uniref:Peptide hydrolase n=1 Tax=Dentiscutata erythropus TaxID=1348616 RepID=A0A9N9CF50_9GLOM|nr:8157_t:CDS:2 [Dentiscutata erythropus]